MNFRQRLRQYKVVQFFSSVKLAVVCLILLFILTFWGTVAQVHQGLYIAQERFFHSFFFLVFGFIPFPGAQGVMWVLLVNLVCVALTRMVYTWRNIGILIIHFGLFLFLISGYVTLRCAQESFLNLYEGQSSNVSSAYHDWEISVWKAPSNEQPGQYDRKVTAVDAKHLKAARTIDFVSPGFQLTVKEYYKNCDAYTGEDKGVVNASGIQKLQPKDLDKEPQKNTPGGIFQVMTDDGKSFDVLLFGSETRPTTIKTKNADYKIILRLARYPLPFQLKLVDFMMEQHPGTDTPRSFKSQVAVQYGKTWREKLISMNNPLRYQDYTLYQASYSMDEAGNEASTLAVVKNQGRVLPYAATFVMFTGLVIHFVMRAFASKKKILTAVLFALTLLGTNVNMSWAQEICPLNLLKPKKIQSLEVFKGLSVLDKGRIKPLDTFAQSLLLQFSGRPRYEKENASQWFARFLFAPRTTFQDKIFLINNPEILEALQIEPEKKRRYSYRQLEQGVDKLRELAGVANGIDAKNQSVVDKELVRVYSNLQLFVQLSGAFGYGFQHPDFTIASAKTLEILELPADKNEYSFFDIVEKADHLQKATASLERKPMASWNETDKDLVRLMNGLFFWTKHYSDCPLGIIPTKNREDEQWISPMDSIRTAYFEPEHRAEVKYLRDMTLAYWSGTQLEFDLAARAFKDSIRKRISSKEKKAVNKIPLECLYNQLGLFGWARLFYGLTFLIFLFSLLSEKQWFYKTSWALVLAGFSFHLCGLILRISILSRPPVSNLYETFIFVGLVAALLGIILELVNKNWLGLVVSGVCGFGALTIAGKFSSDGDTLQVLIAVLNSNFWLSTHVTSITTGYAGCCVAGIMGHIYILQAMTKPNDKKRLEVTDNNMLGIVGFGLTMAVLGTALGGIWADQSWGRFWGWDPKENGALLIILWCAILLHSRISKLINPLGMAVGCVFLLIVVMWAWFGVNLLSVGLHSYGFTSGIANTLSAYVIAEFLFMAVGLIVLGKKGIRF